MNERGATIIEVLVSVLAGIVVLFGIGSFYVTTQGAIDQGSYQAALQRQGSLVQQEMARIILASSGLLAGSCGPGGATDSLPVQVPANALLDSALSSGGFVCFYLDSNQIMECRFTSTSRTCITGSARSLLTGAPIHQPIQAAIPAGLTTMFSRAFGGTAVDINFALTAGVVGPFSFGTRLTVRN